MSGETMKSLVLIVELLVGMVGCGFLLMLNGQHFTNAIVFSMCMLLNCFLSGWWFLKYGEQRKRLLLFVVMLVLGLAMLRPAYERQRAFNQRTENISKSNNASRQESTELRDD